MVILPPTTNASNIVTHNSTAAADSSQPRYILYLAERPDKLIFLLILLARQMLRSSAASRLKLVQLLFSAGWNKQDTTLARLLGPL